MIGVLRAVLLLSGLASILFSTAYYHQIGVRLTARWWGRFGTRRESDEGSPVPDLVVRTWGALSGIISIMMSWYLGSPSGGAPVRPFLGSVSSH